MLDPLIADRGALHRLRVRHLRRLGGREQLRTSVIVAAVGVLAVGAAAELVGGAGQLLQVSLGDLIAGEVIGLGGVVCIGVSPRRPTGYLLLLASALWFAATLAGSENGSVAAFGSAVGFAYRGALVSAVLLAVCRPRSLITIAVAVFGWGDALIDPVGSSPTASVLLGAAVVAASVLAPRGRRGLAPALLLALALAGPAVAVKLGQTVDTGSRLLLAADLATALAIAAVTARIVADQRLEDRLADSIVDVAAVSGLGAALASALRDPRIRLLTPGQVGTPPRGRERTLITAPAGDAMLVEHEAGALDSAHLRRGVTTAIGLQIAHDQRTAELAAAAGEVERAQRRIVLAADAARARLQRRLEREAISRAEVLCSRLAGEPATMQAAHQLSDTVAQLRELASGLHPAALRSGGLALALAGMARQSQPVVTVDVTPARYPEEVELVAYYACTEAVANALKHARASHISVSVTEASGALTASVRDDGAGGADADGRGLSGLAARAGAIGGSVEVESPLGGGTVVLVSLPL